MDAAPYAAVSDGALALFCYVGLQAADRAITSALDAHVYSKRKRDGGDDSVLVGALVPAS
jgi:hypothetical protein